MANYKYLFRKASLTLVDGLLLILCAASLEGHAYMGRDSVKWEHDKLVFVKRVADMSGKGSFVETKEQLSPTPEAWKRFWTRIDSLGVWQWKADYSDPKRGGPDGESWALTLRWGKAAEIERL